jgi:hypothetical protein
MRSGGRVAWAASSLAPASAINRQLDSIRGAQGLAWIAGEIQSCQHRLALFEESGQGRLDEGLAGGEVAVDGGPAHPGRLRGPDAPVRGDGGEEVNSVQDAVAAVS